jgi:hypothetical protein
MNTYRIAWINPQNRVLVAYSVAATVAAALAKFRSAYPHGNVAYVAEVSNG